MEEDNQVNTVIRSNQGRGSEQRSKCQDLDRKTELTTTTGFHIRNSDDPDRATSVEWRGLKTHMVDLKNFSMCVSGDWPHGQHSDKFGWRRSETQGCSWRWKLSQDVSMCVWLFGFFVFKIGYNHMFKWKLAWPRREEESHLLEHLLG